MAYAYSELISQTQHWAAQAVSQGWLKEHQAQQLLDVEVKTPSSLFADGTSRPLIVAFMGGTGVGKSSLLNRLAGSTIARAGAERPTSKEVTLFHFHRVAIANLPGQLPTGQIKVAQHEDEQNKDIIWIDMPDFDSTEQANKQLVLQWLPHVDVLVYVVSPERYRDEKAWRLLLAEGSKHAWIFALNQWDRGQIEQYADFKQQLHKAGFVDPIIFTTSCTEAIPTDEFPALKSTLLNLANSHVVDQLEQRGQRIKTEELQRRLESCKPTLGTVHSLQQLSQFWQGQWQRTCTVLHQGFAWPIKRMAQYYAEHAADLMGTRADQPLLWDAWAQTRLDDALDEMLVHADQLGVPVAPYKNGLLNLREKAAKTIQTESELAVRQALVNPGHVLQRAFLKFVRLCEIILPLTAISWVAYQVFMGYYRSNMTNSHYLGIDFLIHSSLLIAITWLLPFFILKKIKPSLEASALRGLNKGLNLGLATIDTEMATILAVLEQQQARQINDLDAIISNCAGIAPLQQIEQDSPLTRMLVN